MQLTAPPCGELCLRCSLLRRPPPSRCRRCTARAPHRSRHQGLLADRRQSLQAAHDLRAAADGAGLRPPRRHGRGRAPDFAHLRPRLSRRVRSPSRFRLVQRRGQLASASCQASYRALCCRAFAVLILASCSRRRRLTACFCRRRPPVPAARIRHHAEGVRCSQSINASGGYLDLGVAGGNLYDLQRSLDRRDGLLGARAPSATPASSFRWDKSPKRLDCTALYDLEIKRLKQEIDMLKIGLQ